MVVRRLAVIDGLRGIAVVMVMGLHTWYGAGRPMLDGGIGPSITMLISAGYAGVDLFFVISGFVLFLPVCERRGDFGSLRTYVVRRSARILPIYWVTLAVLVMLVASVNVPPAPQSSVGLNLLLHLLYLQHTLGAGLGLAEGFAVNGVVWTLTVEVTFYLLLPFIARRFYNRPALWLAMFFAVSALWRYGVTQVVAGAETTPRLLPLILITELPTYLPHFGLGMVAAYIWVRRNDAQSLLSHRHATIAVLGAGLVIVWNMRELGVNDWLRTAGPYAHHTGTLVVAAAFAVLLLSALMAPGWLQVPFDNAVARKLGEISYDIYLWHCIVIWIATTVMRLPITGALNVWIYVVFVFAGTIGLSWLSHVTIERPVIRWARRRTTPPIADDVREGVH